MVKVGQLDEARAVLARALGDGDGDGVCSVLETGVIVVPVVADAADVSVDAVGFEDAEANAQTLP